MNRLSYITLYFFATLLAFKSHSQNTDSLKLVLKKATTDSTKCITLIALGDYVAQTNGDSALSFFKKSEAISKANILIAKDSKTKKRFTYFLAYSIYTQAIFKINKGNLNESLVLFQESKKQYEFCDDKEGIGNCLNDIGYIYYNKGDITKTLSYYQQALANYKLVNFKEGLAASYINIAPIFQEQGDIKNTLKNYYKGLDIAKELGDKNMIAFCFTNIAQVYSQFGNPLCDNTPNQCRELAYATALDFFNQAIKLRGELGDKINLPAIYNNMGLMCYNQKKNEKAETHFRFSIKLATELDNKRILAYAYVNLANTLLQIGKVDEALDNAKKALTLAKTISFPDAINKSAAALKRIYTKQENYKAALEMNDLQVAMQDSINRETSKKQNIKQQMQITFDKQLFVDSLKTEKGKLIAAVQIEKQKTQKNYLYLIIALVTVSAGFIFIRFRTTQKQKTIIESFNKELERLNILNQKIFSVISHDFKSPIAILKLLLQKNELIASDNPLVSRYIKDVNLQLHQSDEILESLLDWARAELQIKLDTIQTSNVLHVLQKVIIQQQIKLIEKKLVIVNTVSDNNEVHLPSEVLSIAIRNLLSNAIKFSYDEQIIEISFNNNSLQVKDAGKGIDPAKLEKLFTKQVASGVGTKLETGFGLGLYMSSELLNKYNAKLMATNNAEGGCTFAILFT